MNTEDYIRLEVERQYSTKFAEFRDALEFAKGVLDVPTGYSFNLFVRAIAMRVEPEINRHYSIGQRMSNLRQSEVSFAHGGKATPAGEVHEQFLRWSSFYSLNDEGILDMTPEDCSMYVRWMLQIHPWADGNGRTASILLNWLLGTLDDPWQLPYYSF